MSKEPHKDIVEPGVNAPTKTGGPKTVWGHAPVGVATPYTNPENILRKTSMFGVLKVVDGKVVLPQVPPDKVNQYGLLDPQYLKADEPVYYPDMLNDLQLTDHYPLLQETAIGTVCTLNLMKQCRKFDDTDTYNNAFNKEEKLEQYQARLDKLADLIIAMVKENGLPLFTLQEAPSGAEGAAFYAKIERETGCKFASDPTSRDRAGLVTLYDPKKLTPGSVVASTKEAKEQTIEFTPIPPVLGKPFYVTNAHWQLPAAPAGVDRMAKALEKANQPGATHGHLFMGDSNLCANSHAVSKLSDANTQGGQVAAHIAAKKANLQGATSYVEGSLDQSKGGVTTTDIVFASQGMLVPQSTQQSLYVEDASNPFQVAMEEARKDNDGKLDTGVAQLMHKVATKEAATTTAATATTATMESFDVLKGLDAQQKKKIIEAEMAVASKNPALAALKIAFSDMTVTAQNDEHIVRLKATFPGQNGAADVTKELTITRTASPDGKAVMRNCEGEGLTPAQRYAIIAAASFEERKIAGKTDTTITVAIKNTGQTPGKDGLTDDERALVKAYLAAGYTEVTCGKDKKCYTQADFTVAAAVTVEEKSVQGWRRAAKAQPAVTFDNLMQLATAVERARSAEAKKTALDCFQEAVEKYAYPSRQRLDEAGMAAAIAARPEAERELGALVMGVVKSVAEIQNKQSDPTTEENSIAACISKFGDEVKPSDPAVTLE